MATVSANTPLEAGAGLTGRGGQIVQPVQGAVRLSEGNSAFVTPEGTFKAFGISSNRKNMYDPAGSKGLTSYGIQQYDMLVRTTMMNAMYRFAETKAALLPGTISRTVDLPSGRGQFNRIGSTEMQLKIQDAGRTPNTDMQVDVREIQEAILHQGYKEGLDTSRRGYVTLTEEFQTSVAFAIARNMEKWVQIACTDSIGVLGNQVTSSFYGQNTFAQQEFPDANRFVRVTRQTDKINNVVTSLSPDDLLIGATKKALHPGEKFIDDIKEVITSKNLNPRSVVIVGSRNLEKQIQQIPAFRDKDNTLSYHKAYSQTGDLYWHGLNFIFLNYDAYINGREQFVDKHYNQAGMIVASGATNAVKLDPGNFYFTDAGNTIARPSTTALDSKAKIWATYETALIIEPSGLIKGNTYGNYMDESVIPEFSYCKQVYIKASGAYARVDEDKVHQILFKSSTNSFVKNPFLA